MLRETITKACYAGGGIMRDFFHKKYKVDYKEIDQSIVTEADKASEAAILNIIQNAFPTYDILSEERGAIHHGSTPYKWIIDPIDGTANFANRNPLCCVSIACTKGEEVIAGGVYNPFLEELFVAEKGKGAFLNSHRIFVSEKTNLDNSVFSITTLQKNMYKDELPAQGLHKLFDHRIHMRRTGASALDLCWTAMGRFDAFLLTHNLNTWDVAAGMLMVEEAGGVVKNINGQPFSIYTDKTIIASNADIADTFLNYIKSN